MLSTQPQLLRLSQGQLHLLEICPRQFQHAYLEQLHSPTEPERQEYRELGSRFHLLVQQQEMGLPIDSFLQAEPQLQTWMKAFADAAPEILASATDSYIFRESEHYRSLQVQNYLLTVVYDLLIADNQKAQIFDWKTYPQPPNQRQLEQNWQTRLYTYVLAETSDYLPEEISMTYWFIQSQQRPQIIKLNYSTAQHHQTGDKLMQLLSKLTAWLEIYYCGEDFPQLPEGSKACQYCQFAKRCQRTHTNFEMTSAVKSFQNAVDNNLLNLASIQEVSLEKK